MNITASANLLPQVHRAETVLAWWRGRAVTAAEFLQHVALVAAGLPEASAAVNLCEDRYLFMVTFAALLQRGQINLLPPNRVPQVVAEAAAAYADVYYVAEHSVVGLALPSHQVVVPEQCLLPETYTPLVIEAGQIACVLYTSGSTGKPAANVKTWGSLVAGSMALRARLALAQDTAVTLVATVPAQHMFGLETTVLLPLLGGYAVHAGRPFFPEDVRCALAEVPALRVLISTPLHLRACVGAGLTWPGLVRVISATAPLSAELALDIERTFACVATEIYGSTETGAIATRRPTQLQSWQALPQVSFALDAAGATVQAPYISGPVRLHDAIELQADNTFHLLGRDSDMLNIAGKRASLGDLTHKLLQIQGVEDAVIIQQSEDEAGVARLCALVVAPGVEHTVLQRALLQCFDPVFMPRPLYLVERLPRTAAGKLPRHDVETLLQRLRESHGTA